MQKIVVTGGAGFIGSHLVEQLLEEEDNQVLVLDDLSVGSLANLPKSNRLEISRVSILNEDISKGRIFAGADVVYHLAALTRPKWSLGFPLQTHKVNVEGTLKVLQACVEGKVGKFIFVSSASVYGKQNKLLLSENMQLNPMSPYALTKLVGENYCKLYGEIYGLRYDIVRPFNVYGPRQSLQGEYSAVVSNFITKLRGGETPQISGNGKQVRDFIYVKDVVRLLTLVGDRKASGEIFNAGSGKCTSVRALYKKICKLMNVEKKPGHREASPYSTETQADTSKVKRLLGWEPEVNLKEGLKQTIMSQS